MKKYNDAQKMLASRNCRAYWFNDDGKTTYCKLTYANITLHLEYYKAGTSSTNLIKRFFGRQFGWSPDRDYQPTTKYPHRDFIYL